MGQEYFINSQELEDKVRDLLPSQGGAGAGFDLSASTQIIPVIDLTESAQGSNLRTDLQTALDGASTEFNISNASNTSIVTTTGFFRVYGTCTLGDSGGNQQRANFNIWISTFTCIRFFSCTNKFKNHIIPCKHCGSIIFKNLNFT